MPFDFISQVVAPAPDPNLAPAGVSSRRNEGARWRLVHRSRTSTGQANRASDEVELVGEPKIQEAPPEVIIRSLFTKETLADYLRVSVYTVQRLVQDGVLTAIKVGSQVRFHIDDVDRFLDQCRTGRPDERSGPRGH